MATFVIKDKNLVPENIKKGVTILKVTGTLEGGGPAPVLRNASVDSSTVLQEVLPGQGYDGLSKVTVSPYELDSKTVDSSTVSQTVTSSKNGLSSVTVNPYTLQSKTVDSSSSGQIVTPDQNYNGLSQVTVNGMAIIDGVEETFDQNGQYVIHASDYDAQGISDITIDVSVEGSSSDSSVYQNAFGITQSLDMRSAAPRCIMTDHVIDNANFVGMSGYIAAPYSQNPYWVFGVDCDVQSKAPAGPKFGIYVNGDDMTFYFGETDGLTVSNEDTDFQNGAYFNVYEDTDDTGDHIVEVNGVTYDYEEETGLGWMSNTISNELYIFARNANGTAYDIAPEGTFFQCLYLNYDDGDSYTSGFEAAVEGYINESGWFESSTPVLYYWGIDDEGIIQMPSGYSYNVINMYDTVINNDIINLAEHGDSELVMFNPSDGRPAGVIIPVAGGSDWLVDTLAGNITDLSGYTLPSSSRQYQYNGLFSSKNLAITKSPRIGDGNQSDGQSSYYGLFKNITTLTYLDCSGITISNGQTQFSEICSGCTNLTTIDFSNMTAVLSRYVFSSAFNNCPNLVNAIVHPDALAQATNIDNHLLKNVTTIQNLTLTAMATDNVDLEWQSQLTAASVLNVLTHLDLNTSGKTVTFYTNGLSVQDDAQGSIQTAYDAATTAGWTISNLTIQQYEPPIPPTYTKVDYIQSTGQTLTVGNTLGYHDAVYAEYEIATGDGGIFIGADGQGSEKFGFGSDGQGTLYEHYGTSGVDTFSEGADISTNYCGVMGIYTDDVGGWTWTDGTSCSTYPSYSTDDFQGTGNNLLRFADANNYGKLRSLKVYTGLTWPDNIHFGGSSGTDIVITADRLYNYVPVQRVSDSAYGLYDTSTGTFYTAQGITGGMDS